MANNITVTTAFFFKTMIGLPAAKIFCVYMFLVAMSPVWQAFTKPIVVRPVLVVYNFLCTLLSVCTLLGSVYFGVFRSPSIFYTKESTGLDEVFFLYHVTKNIELMDTVFMVLRHRQRQISFLHVFHHSSMLLLTGFAAAATPIPAIAIMIGLNSFVHIVLYIYYGTTAMFPNDPPQWKKRITQLQILQFLIGLVFTTYGYRNHNFCIYSILYGLIMAILFSNFYYYAYVGKPLDLEGRKCKPE